MDIWNWLQDWPGRAGWSIEANLGAKHWINDVNVNYALQIGDDPPIF